MANPTRIYTVGQLMEILQGLDPNTQIAMQIELPILPMWKETTRYSMVYIDEADRELKGSVWLRGVARSLETPA